MPKVIPHSNAIPPIPALPPNPSSLPSLLSAQVFWRFTFANSVSIPIPYLSQLNLTLFSAPSASSFGEKLNLPCSCIPCHTPRIYTPDSPRFSESLPLPPHTETYALSDCPTSTRDPPSLALSSSKPPCLLLASPHFSNLYPPTFISFIYKKIFLFFLSYSYTSLFHLSNSFNHPNTSAFVNLSFLILNPYPILSSTLFSTFHLTDLTPNLVLTSIMFSYLGISLYGSYLTTLKILITFIYQSLQPIQNPLPSHSRLKVI